MTTAPPTRRPPTPLRLLLAPLYLLERSRGRRRWALIGAYLAILGVAGVYGWRWSRVAGLPDAVPPWLEAVRAIDVPDDRNAFVLYRRAAGALRHDLAVERRLLGGAPAWPKPDDAEGLAYLEANAAAMELYRAGTERPDAMIVRPRDLTFDTQLAEVRTLWHFGRLALVFAARDRDAGDMAGARGWYRAALRGSRHAGRNMPLMGRLLGVGILDATVGPTLDWAADPRVDAPLLRAALDDAEALDALGATEADMLRIEYAMTVRSLAEPESLRAFLRDQRDRTLWVNHLDWPSRAHWWVENEPERARRLSALFFRNLLAGADRPPSRRGPALRRGPGREDFGLYDAPTAGVSARDLAARLEGSPIASFLFPTFGGFRATMARERAALGRLRLGLAEQLFIRERGGPPARPGDLVGPYLDRLPEGYDAADPPSTLPATGGPNP